MVYTLGEGDYEIRIFKICTLLCFILRTMFHFKYDDNTDR